MKTFKRSVCVIFCILLAVGLFAGCASKTKDEGQASMKPKATEAATSAAPAASAAPTQAAAEKVEITFWRVDFAPEVDSIKRSIATFEAKYPNIKVKMEPIPNDQYETKIRTALAASNAPDVMALDAPTLANYAAQNALLPLDDYLNKDGNKDDIAAPVLKGMTYEGKVYASPLNDASLAMFYNKKMFAAKGIKEPSQNPDEAWTWEQVLDAAKKLNDPGKGIYGWNPSPWGFAAHEGVPFADMTYLWQAGAEILSPDGSTATGYLDSPATKKALTFFSSLYNKDKVSPKELPADGFANGKVAIDVNGPWNLAYLSTTFPNFKLGEDYGVAPLWKGDKQVTPNGSWNLAITAKSKHPNEAWLFINWITGIEGSKTWYSDTKNLPARASTAQAFPELAQYPMNIFVAQSAKFAHPRPVVPSYPTVSLAIRTMFENVGLGNKDIDASIAEAVKKINQGITSFNK